MKTKIENYFTDFQFACLDNYDHIDENGDFQMSGLFPEVEKAWNEATSKKDFLRRIFNDPDAKTRQYYGVLSRECEPETHVDRLHTMLAASCTASASVDAEGGSVLVKTAGLSVHIGNGYGDGTFMVYVIDNEKAFNRDMMTYTGTMLEGSFSVMSDFGEPEQALILTGRYGVYKCDGTVAFVRW